MSPESEVNETEYFNSVEQTSYDMITAIRQIIVLPCCLIGIPSNAIICAILVRNNCGLANSARLCYSVICAADSMTLASYLFRSLPYLLQHTWAWPGWPHNSLLACSVERFVTCLGIGMSSSTVIVLCAQQLYHVTHPLRSKRQNVFKVTLAVIATFLLLHLVSQSVLFSHYELQWIANGRKNICRTDKQVLTQVLMLSYSCCNALFQVLQAVVTFVLVSKLAHVRKRRSVMLATRPTTTVKSREKLLATGVIAISAMYTLIICPQYVGMTVLLVDNMRNVINDQLRASLRFAIAAIGQLDAVLWCSNFLVLFRVPAFRKQFVIGRLDCFRGNS